MGKRKPLPLLEKVEIIDAGSEGKALARVNDLVVFVPFAVPGDVADIQVVRKKRRFYEGRVIKYHEYSEKRVEALCDHFGICGGCKWQNMDYSHQLFYKQKQVQDNFDRLGKFPYPAIRPIISSDNIFHYRNKMEYTFSSRRWYTEPPSPEKPPRDNRALGFHVPGMFDRVIDIEKCHLQDDLSNQIRNAVKEYAKENDLIFYDVKTWEGFLRNLIVRNTTTGQWMVTMVFRNDSEDIQKIMDFIRSKFPGITSLNYCINSKKNDDLSDQEILLHSGQTYIIEELPPFLEDEAPLKFKIGPKSFFQTNSQQAEKLYRVAAEFASPADDPIIYDLYTGTGTIALYMSGLAKQVIGIENIEEAVRDAYENAALNDIENVEFLAGDLAKTLDENFVERYGKPDIVVTDPPRSGMHPKVVEQIIKASPERVVYVSCNPATQARDIAMMQDYYSVEAVQPVDMFPHTQHVENVALLVRK
jgi:23S rRNA (uracil1939-C5)-methyltransferase